MNPCIVIFGISIIVLCIVHAKHIEHYVGEYGADYCKHGGRICTKDSKCIATEEDVTNAMHHAYRQLCERDGHKYERISDDSYDCVHTRETCLRDSTYPETDDKKYLHWSYDNKCMKGIPMLKEYCKHPHRYDERDGRCYITKASCDAWGADYKNNDCVITGAQKFGEAVFGTTVVRSIDAGFKC
jgi:hypothetical protein